MELSEDGRPSATSQRIQEIAAEVLRLRLQQSQYKQLEAQLKAAMEKLQSTSDKVVHFAQYLEQGLRPGGSIGRLGGSFSGVEPESLLGLMECLCVVCSAPVSSRKQEDLLAATKWLLQEPNALIWRLSQLPPAAGMQSRRLAPYLLSCDGGWRGQVNEAGQCYEALRSWLCCYYQFSLVSSEMELLEQQLQRQEQLLSELSKEDDRGWRLKRSASVQSTSSAGSRRSPSPGQRGVCVARRATREIREAMKSPGSRALKTEKRQVAEPSPRVRLMPSVLGTARVPRSGSAAAPPGPPAVSPRRPYSARASYTEPKTLLTRRHVVPARVRRPSEPGGKQVATVRVEEAKPVSPRGTAAFTRSRSLQSITEPEEARRSCSPAGATRVACRPLEARRSQVTPIGGRLVASAAQLRPQVVTAVRKPAATPPSTPGAPRLQPRVKPYVVSKEVARDLTPSPWALATSRSSPEVRLVLGRQLRETALATPRPLFSGRALR